MMQVADQWFEKRSLDDGVTLIWEPYVVPLLRCNIWHVRGRDRDMIIDTGMGVVSLRTFARDILDRPVSAVATHAHIDHIGCHCEFDETIVHRLEADGLRHPDRGTSLGGAGFDPCDIATLHIPPIAGYAMAGPMITLLPDSDYDLRQYVQRPAQVTREVEDGDVIDLGDRVFEVLHLPGHSPGGIGLWEAATGMLFSGDAVYDGPLLDTLHHSNRQDYHRTMRRLQSLPARVVHAGHDPSFGHDRLRELTDGYLAQG